MKFSKSQEKEFFNFEKQITQVTGFIEKYKEADPKKIVSKFAGSIVEGLSFIDSFTEKITEDLTFHKDKDIVVDRTIANSILGFVKKNITLNAYSHQILNNKKVTSDFLKEELIDWFKMNEKAGNFVKKFIK